MFAERPSLHWRRWTASSSQRAWSMRTTSSMAMRSLSPLPLGPNSPADLMMARQSFNYSSMDWHVYSSRNMSCAVFSGYKCYAMQIHVFSHTTHTHTHAHTHASITTFLDPQTKHGHLACCNGSIVDRAVATMGWWSCPYNIMDTYRNIV